METAETTAPDAELVSQVLDGDNAAFEWLMRRYNQRIYRIIRSILRDEAEAEDVVQDAYVRAFEHLRQLSDRTHFAGWLTRIAMHEAFARLRARQRFQPLLEGGQQEENEMTLNHHPSSSPEAVTARHEIRRMLETAIDRLPQPYRTVIMMRDIEELSTEETAECLQITPANVKVRLHRARTLLRRELWERTGSERRSAFDFPATRCNRVVAAVFARLGISRIPS